MSLVDFAYQKIAIYGNTADMNSGERELMSLSLGQYLLWPQKGTI